MTYNQITVGLDGSAAARRALRWAAREARRRGARLVAVTAWTDDSRSVARARGDLVSQRHRLERMQRECIAATNVAVAPHLRISRQLVFGDPVVALCHAAGRSDLVVLGGVTPGPPTPGSTAARVAARLAARRRSDPNGWGRLVTVAAMAATAAPRTRAVAVHARRLPVPVPGP